MVCDNKTEVQKYYRLIKSYINQLRLSRFAISRREKRKVMTIGYVAAIFVAFTLSLTNNNNVNASITKSDAISYMMLESALNDETYTAVYPRNSRENVKSLFDMVNKKFSKTIEKEFIVQRGDSLPSLFARIGLDKDTSNDLLVKFLIISSI